MENSVLLNGVEYQLKEGTGVTREPISEFPVSLRQQSQQRREDRSMMSSWQFGDFTYGGGIERMDIDNDRDIASFWYSTCETRWKGKVGLPGLVSPILINSTDYLATYSHRGMFVRDEEGYLSLFCDTAPTLNTAKECILQIRLQYPFTGTYGYSEVPKFLIGSLPLASGSHIHNIASILDYKLSYMAVTTPSFYSGYYQMTPNLSPQGGVQYTMFGFNNMAGTMNELAFSKFVIVGGIVCIGVLNAQGDSTDFVYRPCWVHPVMAGSSGASLPPSDVTNAYSSSPPVVAQLNGSIWAGMSTGLYLLNTAQRTYTMKIDTKSHATKKNFTGMRTWQNKFLICPIWNSTEDCGIQLFNPDENTITNIGLNQDDGVPSGRRTEVTALYTTPQHIYAGFMRDFGDIGGIVMCYDGYGWHYITEMPTISDFALINDMDVVGDELFMVGTGKFFGQPPAPLPAYFVSGVMKNSFTRDRMTATYGELVLPVFNAGMPEFESGWYDLTIECDGLGTNNNKIDVYYGLDGAVPTALLGTATINGARILEFGNGLGVSGRSIQLKFALTRGTVPSSSPVLVTHHSPLLHYMKYPELRETFKFTIDFNKTGKKLNQPPGSVMGSLTNLRNSSMLVPFYYGITPTKNVKLVSWSGAESNTRSTQLQQEVSGLVDVTVMELL